MITQETWEVSSATPTEINTPKGIAIAQCGMSNMIDQQEKEDNARLIAAAPDLLKTCNDLLSCLVGAYTESQTTETIKDAEQAIASTQPQKGM